MDRKFSQVSKMLQHSKVDLQIAKFRLSRNSPQYNYFINCKTTDLNQLNCWCKKSM